MTNIRDIRTNWDGDIWKLSLEEIRYGLNTAFDSSLFNEAEKNNNPLIAFAFDRELLALGMKVLLIWDECGGDIVLMKLKLL